MKFLMREIHKRKTNFVPVGSRRQEGGKEKMKREVELKLNRKTDERTV